MKKKKRITIGVFFNYLILTIITFCCLYPFLNVIAYSFSGYNAVLSGKVTFYPIDFTLDAYKEILKRSQIWLAMRTTVVVTIMGTALSLLLTVCAAYALSRDYLPGRKLFTGFILFTMYFGGGMIPNYLLMNNLNLLNTVWVMIIPGAISVYNMIVARTYIVNSIPSELYESASLDGCTDDRYLWSIVLPLSKPIIAVLVLWYAVGHWNAYFNAMIYLKDKSRSPLQIVLREFLIVEDMSEANIADNIEAYMDQLYMKNLYQYSLIVVSAVPVMALYPVIQKYFVKGIMLGSIKG